jgi:hypothetical protein
MEPNRRRLTSCQLDLISIKLIFVNPLNGKETNPLKCLVNTGSKKPIILHSYIGSQHSYLSRSVLDEYDLGLSFLLDKEDNTDIGPIERLENGQEKNIPLHLLRIQIPGLSKTHSCRYPCQKVTYLLSEQFS